MTNNKIFCKYKSTNRIDHTHTHTFPYTHIYIHSNVYQYLVQYASIILHQISHTLHQFLKKTKHNVNWVRRFHSYKKFKNHFSNHTNSNKNRIMNEVFAPVFAIWEFQYIFVHHIIAHIL